MNSPLVNFALKGLDRCWMPEFACWSHIYHLDGRDPCNESVPASDVFYTLNVLLGYSPIKYVPPALDLATTFQRAALRLPDLPVPTYAYGMALWAAGTLDLEIPPQVLSRIEALFSQKAAWRSFR